MSRKCNGAVGDDIHQTKPFASIEEELLVSLLRTGDVLHERFEQIIRPFNISMTQYNVLEQTGMAALSQSNQAQQAVLKLIQ